MPQLKHKETKQPTHIIAIMPLHPFYKKTYLFTALLTLTLAATLQAQEKEGDLGTEVVNVVKPYTPTISDAFKVKQTPIIGDSTTTLKKKVTYTIFSVPVASTFTPAKGTASGVKRVKPPNSYDNYATLGFGNFTTILGELYSNFELSRTDNAGFFIKHNSTQGGIDEALIDNQFYDTQLNGYYNSRQRDMQYGLQAGVEHQIVNWYGINPNALVELPLIQPLPNEANQTYFSAFVGGDVAFDNSLIEKADATLRITTDAFGSSEFNARIQPEISLPVADVNVSLEADIDFLSGGFDQNFFGGAGNQYGFFNIGGAPSIQYLTNDLSVTLGAATYLSVNTQENESNFYIFPNIDASYRIIEEVATAYAGANGGLNQNSFYNFKNENPFISPTLDILPTVNVLTFYGGIKGKLTSQIGYNIRGSYSQEEDKALFVANSFGFPLENQPYTFGNSFQVVYDAVNTLHLFGELTMDLSENVAIGANASFYSFDTDAQAQAWNLPQLEASVFSNFNITQKLYGGTTLFFTGERKDLSVFDNPTVDIELMPVEQTVDAFVDFNVHFGYKLTEQFNVFVKGNNLVGGNYNRWLGFPVQGIQVLGGVTYKFDW